MKAWILPSLDGLGALRLAEIPDPTLGPGDVLLKMQYAALNPADRYLSEKHYPATPPLPHVLGRDGIGTVVTIGSGVANLRIGDKRAVLRGDTGVSRRGTFAEFAAVAADSLIDVPAGWSDEETAGASLVYLTAWQALTQWEDLPANALVLVTGASGGVGVASIQLGLAGGHTMLALSRDPDKRAHLKQLGAAAAFDPTDPNWPRQVLDYLKPRRVDLAIAAAAGHRHAGAARSGEHRRTIGRARASVQQRIADFSAVASRRCGRRGIWSGGWAGGLAECRDRVGQERGPAAGRSCVSIRSASGGV
jgi:NADPH2:quinone reductase